MCAEGIAAEKKHILLAEFGAGPKKTFSLLSLEHMSAVQNMVDGAQDRNRVLFFDHSKMGMFELDSNI